MSRRSHPRIALVVPTFPKLSETFIVRHALGLFDRGFDVHVVCRAFDSAAWEAEPRLAARPDFRRRIHLEPRVGPRWRVLLEVPGTSARLAATSLRAPRALGRLAGLGARTLYLEQTLARLGADLVHFEFASLAVGRLEAVRRLGARSVVSFRGFDLNYVGLDSPDFYAPVWRLADAVHLLGEDLWQRAQRRGCPPEKAKALIPPAVDVARFAPPERSSSPGSGPLRLLSVGRLEWKKGHEISLRALRLLLDQGIDAQLEIVGGGDLLGALSFIRHQLDLDHHVVLAGALPQSAVREKLEQADVFLHLAVSEGFCNAVLEAQAMALPVVASDADGLAENIAHGETGFLVARRDPLAAAEALARLAEDPSLRQRFGRAGRERVGRLFTPERELDAFAALYRSVLESSGSETGRSSR